MDLLKSFVTEKGLREGLLVSGVSRLILNQLRDDFLVPVNTKDEEQDETLKKLTSVRIVSDKSLFIFSIVNFASLCLGPSVALNVMTITLGWEMSGMVYRIIQHYFPL